MRDSILKRVLSQRKIGWSTFISVLLISCTGGLASLADTENEIQRQWQSKLQEINGQLEIKPNDQSLRVKKSMALLGLCRYKECVAEANSAVKLAKTSPAFNARALGYLQLRDYARSLSDANIAIKLDPNNWKAYDTRSMIYGMLGSREKSEADGETSKKLQLRRLVK